jgi:uncharacterized protein YjbJ (UPF0337 family)/ElaB/YqjD/DUF883 family membrane-anchored ribosome-binding protein
MQVKYIFFYIVVTSGLSIINGRADTSPSSSQESSMSEVRHELKKAAHDTKEVVKKGTKKVVEKTKKGARTAKEKIKEGIEYVGEKVHHTGENAQTKTKERINHSALIPNWHQAKGKVRVVWGKLTHDDVEQIGGRLEVLYGILQEKYNYTREEAKEAYERVKEKLEK